MTVAFKIKRLKIDQKHILNFSVDDYRFFHIERKNKDYSGEESTFSGHRSYQLL